ncbi:Protein of unknown function [Cotesia congregata]|uniref:Uncharacterized protein n=1 Tax=Cotesia congregata TaxID=51543 RepID=A0A8J2HNB0_COTCN|nr:Protein of unknown function [Cotesia congregata]
MADRRPAEEAAATDLSDDSRVLRERHKKRVVENHQLMMTTVTTNFSSSNSNNNNTCSGFGSGSGSDSNSGGCNEAEDDDDDDDDEDEDEDEDDEEDEDEDDEEDDDDDEDEEDVPENKLKPNNGVKNGKSVNRKANNKAGLLKKSTIQKEQRIRVKYGASGNCETDGNREPTSISTTVLDAAAAAVAVSAIPETVKDLHQHKQLKKSMSSDVEVVARFGSPFKGQIRAAEDTLVGPCGKKRCADRYDSSESSDRCLKSFF